MLKLYNLLYCIEIILLARYLLIAHANLVGGRNATFRQKPLEEQSDTQPFIFVDEQSTQLFNLACKVAVADVSVLINGPTGAGKE